MTRVLATGTFDLLHPGHIHYLRESAALGDELYVIVARESMVDHKEVYVPERQRLEVVRALGVVDHALLGSEESIYVPLSDIEPDIVTLGHDQDYRKEDLEEELASRGYDADVVRIGRRAEDGMVLSASGIVDRILERRGRR